MTIGRNEHCHFKRLNTSGKCIAECSRNQFVRYYGRLITIDCIGRRGRTMDLEHGRESRLVMACKLDKL